MKILSRYIIREHIPPFIFALAVLMFIFLMQFMLKYITRIFGKGLSAITIIELVFYNLAWMFALAVPMSVLIATLMSFGRLSGDNEITILKSSGISIYRIIRPALIFGGIITALMIVFNDRVLPDFNHRARVMFSNIGQKKATLKLEPGIFFTVGKVSFHVEKIEKTLGEELSERTNILGPEFASDPTLDRLRQVTIFDNRDPSKIVTLIADEGYMVYSKKKKSLLFALFDCEYHELNTIDTEEYRFSHLARYNFTLAAPEFELENRDDNIRGDREMDVEMMLDRVETFSREKKDEAQKISDRIEERLNLMAKSSRTESSDTGSVALAEITPSVWKEAADKAHRRISREYQSLRISSSRIKNSNRMINSYMVEIHKKFSIPFASIVFILIGAPLGIAARKGSLGVGATFSIIFFLVYWACLILGEDLADRQFMPPMLAMWFPNIVLGIIGSYLTWRTVKETTIIKWDKLGRFLRRKRKKPEDQPDSP